MTEHEVSKKKVIKQRKVPSTVPILTLCDCFLIELQGSWKTGKMRRGTGCMWRSTDRFVRSMQEHFLAGRMKQERSVPGGSF